MDCIQPLLDRTEDVEDSGNFEVGAFVIEIGLAGANSIKYNTDEEIVEDLLDVQGKLKMLNADFTMRVTKSKRTGTGSRETETISLTKTTKDVEDLLDLLDGERVSKVIIYVYNKETVQGVDLD